MPAEHHLPGRVDKYLKHLTLQDKLRLMEQLESVRLYDNQVANASVVLVPCNRSGGPILLTIERSAITPG